MDRTYTESGDLVSNRSSEGYSRQDGPEGPGG